MSKFELKPEEPKAPKQAEPGDQLALIRKLERENRELMRSLDVAQEKGAELHMENSGLVLENGELRAMGERTKALLLATNSVSVVVDNIGEMKRIWGIE